jgi:hypothetical protein
MRSSGRHGADLDICVMANFNGVCHNENNRDWATGELLCMYEGARLCTLDEITVGVLQDTGCNLGPRHIWTNTAVSQKSACLFVRPLSLCTFSVSGLSLFVFKLSLSHRLRIIFGDTIILWTDLEDGFLTRVSFTFCVRRLRVCIGAELRA